MGESQLKFWETEVLPKLPTHTRWSRSGEWALNGGLTHYPPNPALANKPRLEDWLLSPMFVWWPVASFKWAFPTKQMPCPVGGFGHATKAMGWYSRYIFGDGARIIGMSRSAATPLPVRSPPALHAARSFIICVSTAHDLCFKHSSLSHSTPELAISSQSSRGVGGTYARTAGNVSVLGTRVP